MVTINNIPSNCEFPQLREIVDTEKMVHTLQRYLEPCGRSLSALNKVQVVDCKIDKLHYEPGAGCRFLLTANLRRNNNHEIRQQIFFGELFGSRSARAAFASINRENLAQPEFGPPVFYVPEWETMLWGYPNDPNLPGLSLMVNAGKILALAKATPGKFGLTQPPVAITAEMTKYVPGRRCGFIYFLALPAANVQDVAVVRGVYGKAFDEGDGEKAYMIMKQLWESEARRKGDFILPQPYSYDPEMRILWQEAFSGRPFAKIAENLPNLPEVAKEIGARLAAFHGIPLQLPLERTLDFQIEKVRQAVAAIRQAFPDHAKSCLAIGHKLLDVAARLGPGPVTPVHADFKFSHIFATKQGIAFIDFDDTNLGDPGYDLGHFIAHVYKMTANGKATAELIEQTVINFCAAYNRAAAFPVSQERIDWFAASHLISSEIYHCAKRMKPRLVNKLLEIAEHLCPA